VKALIYSLVFVGSLIGSYIPVWFWHAGFFSGWSIILGGAGGLAGIWAAVKLNNYFD